MTVRAQPNRVDWPGRPDSLELCSDWLGTQFESVDQMFQILFEDVANIDPGPTGPTGAGVTGPTGPTGPTGAGTDPFSALKFVLGTTFSMSSTGPTTITGMTFPFAASKTYMVDFVGLVTSAALTSGFGFALTASTGVTHVGFQTVHPSTVSGVPVHSSSIASAAKTTFPIAAFSSGAGGQMVVGSGFLQAAATGGTCSLQIYSEVTGSAKTVISGACIRVMLMN